MDRKKKRKNEEKRKQEKNKQSNIIKEANIKKKEWKDRETIKMTVKEKMMSKLK